MNFECHAEMTWRPLIVPLFDRTLGGLETKQERGDCRLSLNIEVPAKCRKNRYAYIKCCFEQYSSNSSA